VSAEPSLATWSNALLVLALGVAVVVGLATLLARWPATAAGRRAVWQAATLALAGLLVAEMTGLAGEAANWLSRQPPPRDTAAPGEAKVPSADTPGPARRLESDNAGPVGEFPAAASLEVPAPAGPPAAVWWPGAVWLAGALAVAARVVLARVLLVAFRLRHRSAGDQALLERVRTVAGRVGLRRRVRVIEAEGLVGPVAFGVLRPTVALPARFAETFAPAQQEVILAHELTHLAAGDPAWHLLAELATAALWWHPLAWWARQQLRAAAEMAADESSLLVADGPAVLARCLVELGGVLAGTRSAGWLRMAGSGFRSGLGRRVERLVRLDGRAWRPPGRLHGLATLFLVPAALLAAAVLSTAWARARAFPEGDEPMRHPWKQSLAGLLLVAALGPNTGPGLAGDPPAGPPANDPNRFTDVTQKAGATPTPPPEAPPAGAAGSSEDAARTQLQQTDDAIRVLTKAQADLNARLEALRKANDDQPRDTEAARRKLADQLRTLHERATQLEVEKAALEAKIHELEARTAETAVRIKVFRLEHQDPEELRAVIEALLLNRPGPAGPAGAEGAGMAMGPMGGSGPGAHGGMMRPQGMGGSGMMGAGGVMRGQNPFGGGPAPSWRLAADRRSRSLIARGTEQDLKTVADLVAALDVADGKPMPRLKNVRVFRLRYANAPEVVSILGALDLNGVAVGNVTPGQRLIVAYGPEPALKEVAEVIEAVDVEGKPGTTPPTGAPAKP
jgi:hypothetical protein